MAYVQSKIVKNRLQEKRRVSGAALLREELNNHGDSSSLLDGLPAFQQNKGVMMANFEEWIKMATDNKINSTNSWNFALIDYFHDLNVLRGNDNNINFQKASATLDGCVKIYSSRVDSVATETGRLLSGLATRKQNNERHDEDDEDDENNDGEDDEDDSGNSQRQKGAEDGNFQDGDAQTKKKGSRINKARSSGDTLTTFDNLRIKKLSLELAIDPLFKKTLAEFDEGGAKSLLLNTLHMDNHSRVVFDASTTKANDDDDDEDQDEEIDDNRDEDLQDVDMSGTDDQEIDISKFQNYIYQDDEELDSVTLCPSIGHLQTVLTDINKAKSILNDVNQRNGSDSPKDKSNVNFNDAYDDYVDYGGAEDLENSFGEIENEAAAVIFQDKLDPELEELSVNNTGVIASVVDQDLMSYFDNTLKRNWAGPDHWKVRQLKKEKAHELQSTITNNQKAKKPKENFVIDFLTENEDEDQELESKIFAKSKTSTTIPQDQWDTPDSNLLPDDLYFSSEQLTKLFLKPNQKLNIFRKRLNVRSSEDNEDPEESRAVDATFWAENYERQEKENEPAKEDNPFYDDSGFGGGDGPEDFGDYSFPEDNANLSGTQEKINFGTQLITGGAKVKPEYVNYSKVAKNVNIKVLKDNIWNVLGSKEETTERKFSSVVQDVGKYYNKDQKRDLSTSFCFICLLHLANEHNLTIENDENLVDLQIKGLGKSDSI